jgi:beta-xylosidase
MRCFTRLLLNILIVAPVAASCQAPERTSSDAQPAKASTISTVWSPDLGDGRYKNPILNADYSDPDAIRVGDRFYLVASSFDSVPGLPILESYDLVNWRIIGHALTTQPPLDRYSGTQHGNGAWAPAIRFHDGEFYIFYPDPDFGIYMIRAKTAVGPWSRPLLVKAAKGWIDPCPLWDQDGKAYLISGLAASRAGAKSALVISRMKPDGTELLDGGAIVYDGHSEDTTVEGPKLYKRHGYYYIFAPAGGVPTGWQIVLRSRNIFGPYERRKVLQQGTTAINGPHQGAWVDTGTGQDWFLHFQDRGWLGRVVHLEPMKWVDDWPEIGDISKGPIGQPVLTYEKPRVQHLSVLEDPADSDEFNSSTVGMQWQWQGNPEPTWGFPSQALGLLRLIAVPGPKRARNLWDIPSVLMQKSPASRFVATVNLNAALLNNDERAGLVLMGKTYSALVVAKTEHGEVIRQVLCVGADLGTPERIVAETPLSDQNVYLQLSVDEGQGSFSYSSDGEAFHPIGVPFLAEPGMWVGAKIGIFAGGKTDHGEFGYADFDWFRLTPLR